MDTKKIAGLIEKFKEHHYTKFIKGKSVIIVGPNNNLKGKGLGSYIDRFDIIVRHNTVFDFLPFTQEYKKDYGSRTDILYLSPTCIKNYAHKRSTLETIKKNKIKYICYGNGNRHRKYLTGDYCFPIPLGWFKRFVPARTETKLHYSHHVTITLTEMMNKSGLSDKLLVPRTGFASILDMIVHGAKKIETVGMSFEKGGGHAFRKDAIKEMNPLLTHRGKDSPHDSNIEVYLAKEFTKEYPLKFS